MGSFQYPHNAPSFTFLHCFLAKKKKKGKEQLLTLRLDLFTRQRIITCAVEQAFGGLSLI